MKLKFIILRPVHPSALYETSKHPIPHTLRESLKTASDPENFYDYIAFLSPKASKKYAKEIKPVWEPYKVKKL